MTEPVEEWHNVNGTNLLNLMYHNATRYFGTFELESTFTRYSSRLIIFQIKERYKMYLSSIIIYFRLKQALRLPPLPSQNHGITKTIRLMERSLFSDRYFKIKIYSRMNRKWNRTFCFLNHVLYAIQHHDLSF